MDGSIASSSSSSSEDDEVLRLKCPTVPKRGYSAQPVGLSEESQLLLNEICRQRMLFENRYDAHKLSKNVGVQQANLNVRYLDHGKIQFNSMVTQGFHWRTCKKIYNEAFPQHARSLCWYAESTTLELRLLEAEYGEDLWILQFIVMHNLIVEMEPAIADALFRSSFINSYVRCAETINKRKWHILSRHISGINFMIGEKSSVESLKKLADKDAEHLRLTLRSNNEPVVFYLSSLFLASVQRHLQSYESPELTVELIAETSKWFKSTCHRRMNLWSNPSSFFMLNEFIFLICHSFHERATLIVESPLLQLEPDWQHAFLVYRTVNEYEIFCQNKNPVQGQTLLTSVEGYMDSLKHKEFSLILLPILIELCIYLEEGEILYERLNNLCTDCPYMFNHVCRILTANNCQSALISLFEDLIKSNLDDIASLDVTPALLKVYSQDPAKYGPVDEVIRTNLRAAFATLDYGRNKDNLDAWQTLHANLRRVESNPQIINEFWRDRRSWWPRFHLSPSSHRNNGNECHRVKTKCFKRLNAVS